MKLNTRARLKNQAGQTATEYMLIIAVVVLGAVAGASILLPQFRNAVSILATDIKDVMKSSSADATGLMNTDTAP